jgi:hypothetical protein
LKGRIIEGPVPFGGADAQAAIRFRLRRQPGMQLWEEIQQDIQNLQFDPVG